jgi:hypothetical protein
MVNVVIKMDADALASYKGGVDGFNATSPSTTNKTLRENAAAVSAYRGYLNRMAAGIQRSLRNAVPGAQIGRSFTVAYGGFAAKIPANRAKDIAKLANVSAVQYDTVNQLAANDSPNFVGANAVWPSLGGESKAGQGVKVGILDTGIWPELDMLLDPGITHPGGTYDCEFGLSGETNDDPFVCNDKLIGAHAFLETNLDITGPTAGEYCPSLANCSARDANGHGSHTATTAAGSPVNSAVLFDVDRGHISGIAPGAHVIAYRVCDQDGCYSTDSIDAVEQAIEDDVDVINFSIGGGSSPYTDSVELAFLDAYAAGILVNASAGNDGPGASTLGHAGPWVNTVGASTLNREFGTTLILTADGPDTLNLPGVSITDGISSPTPVVLASAAPYSNELCGAEAADGTFTGKIVVCKRGTFGRVEKGYNVFEGDAAGMILYNQSAGVTDVETDNHFLPTVHVQFASDAVKNFVDTHTNVMATWADPVAQPAQGDIMASFSSRGPVGDFIKPDVTAPGVQILAGNSVHHIFDPADGLGPDGEQYQAIAGTSMSSPHAAGVAILMKDAHPSWTPGQIKSAMMTSSLQSVLKEDGVTPTDPFDRGAGSIRANRANRPVITFDVPAADYYASASDEDNRINLNLPSINAPQMDGIISTTRTARNISGLSQTFDITYSGAGNVTITPSVLSLAPFGAGTFEVKIDATYLEDGQKFGKVTLNPRRSGAINAVLPVAFNKAPGEVTIENSCEEETAFVDEVHTINKGETLNCSVTITNFANEEAAVSARVKAPNTDRLIIKNWSAGNKKQNGFVWNGTLDPALAPEVNSITSPGYGYLGLQGLGVAPEAAYADEEIGLYTGLPTFTFGGEEYDALAIDSNGYLVIGSDVTDEDNNCCDPLMPDPARPNNVLAPYWTDLDPSSASSDDIFFAELDFGGGLVYLVVEWRQIAVFGTTNTRTFQVWIAESSAPEDIAFEYCITTNESAYPNDGCNDAAPGLVGAGAPDGLVVGAENRDGSDAATIGPEDTQPSNLGYVVDMGEPQAGGTMEITYDAFGKRWGHFDIKATMTTSVTPGTSISVVRVHVLNAGP